MNHGDNKVSLKKVFLCAQQGKYFFFNLKIISTDKNLLNIKCGSLQLVAFELCTDDN